jgi:arylsulfatase A-like enzyme
MPPRRRPGAGKRGGAGKLLPYLAIAAALGSCGPREPRPPNIVVILIDDLGARDLASYGHSYHRTPAIDRLASEGLRFTRAYAASPVCAPTRAALLTGKSPARLHLTHSLPPQPAPLDPGPATAIAPPVHAVSEPRSATWLDPVEVTIAERLRDLGYRTALIGKWHLGRGESAPTRQGFEVARGGEEEAAPPSFFDPYGLPLLEDRAPGEYLTDRLTEEAEAFLEASAGEPFFLLLSHFAVHTPIVAPAERVGEWSARLAAAGEPLAERGRSLRAEYAAMLESVDASVERVLTKLEELDLERDTMVVLTSDNGGLLETPDTGEVVTDNQPLRGGKATLYEGGLRVPLVVRWPRVVAAASETDVLATTVDWFPTLLAVAGGEETSASSALDGHSLLPVLRGQTPAVERSLHFHYPHYIPGYRHDPARETWWNTPGAAVRAGAAKLVRRFGGADELYDLDADPGETRDVAGERPDLAARLGADLDAWLEREDAHLPVRNSAYDPEAFGRAVASSWARLGASSEWTPNGGCARELRSGRLALDCTTHPFVIGPEMVVRGPLRVALRCSATGTRGGGSIWYRSPEKPSFDGGRVALGACGPDLDVREAVVPHEGTVRQLRIDFGRGAGGRVEVDWIRIMHAEDDERTLVEWSFDRPEAQAHAR